MSYKYTAKKFFNTTLPNFNLSTTVNESLVIPENIKNLPIPQHIAIIMDGNGRWALKRGMSRIKGHERGAQNIIHLLDSCFEIGISVISLYSFSTENWKRPKQEIMGLLRLLEKFIKEKLNEIKAKEIKVIVSGNIEPLPKHTKRWIERAIEETKKNHKMVANFCFNYGARDEIHRATHLLLKEKLEKWKESLKQPNSHDLSLLDIKPEDFEKYLYTSELPNVDFLVRTAGQLRLSNFLLYQSAYAELYFTDVLWPDFTRDELLKSITVFQSRERKFGGLLDG